MRDVLAITVRNGDCVISCSAVREGVGSGHHWMVARWQGATFIIHLSSIYQPFINHLSTAFQPLFSESQNGPHMMPTRVQQKKSRHAPSSVKTAITKLLAASNTIHRREGVRPVEGKRIQEAFKLLTGLPEPVHSKTRRREHFREFLIRVDKTAGLGMVALCAVGLGQSTVGNMKDQLRLRLPLAIKNREGELNCATLRGLVEKYSAKGLSNTLSFVGVVSDSGSVAKSTI